jgi:hypothetical protein
MQANGGFDSQLQTGVSFADKIKAAANGDSDAQAESQHLNQMNKLKNDQRLGLNVDAEEYVPMNGENYYERIVNAYWVY